MNIQKLLVQYQYVEIKTVTISHGPVSNTLNQQRSAWITFQCTVLIYNPSFPLLCANSRRLIRSLICCVFLSYDKCSTWDNTRTLFDTASVTEDDIFNMFMAPQKHIRFNVLFFWVDPCKEHHMYSELTTISKFLLVPFIYNTKTLHRLQRMTFYCVHLLVIQALISLNVIYWVDIGKGNHMYSEMTTISDCFLVPFIYSHSI